MKSERVIVLGSHKGLGFACVEQLLNIKNVERVLGLSRQDSGVYNQNSKYSFCAFDFTQVYDRPDQFLNLFEKVEEFQPTQIIYCAGGGPFGEFSKKQWKDHEWAFKLNFLFPAKLLWSILESKLLSDPLNFLYVGSAIAESEKGDPMGPSYSAGKWAMKGLYLSLINKPSSNVNLKWISPGYMDTELLPKGASVRSEGKVQDPATVATEIITDLGL